MRLYPAPIKDRPVRLALVGCGRIAQNPFAAIKAHSDRAELVDVCDIVEDAAGAAGNLTGARMWTSLPNMLRETTADVVILTTPSGIHARQAMEVASSGRHVITEKPMATRWHDGR